MTACCNSCANGGGCKTIRPEGSWLSRMWGALSQLLNTFLFNGHPNESVSARAWREDRKRWVRAIDTVFFWEPSHCQRSYEHDVRWARQLTGN